MSKPETRPRKEPIPDHRAATKQDAALDEALDETFPASDPIAVHSEHDDDIRKPAKR
jgi:hypothetical protein